MIKKNQYGFTLIEVILALSIIVSLIITSFFLFDSFIRKKNITDETKNLKTIKNSLDSIKHIESISFNSDLFKALEFNLDRNGSVIDVWKNKIDIKKMRTMKILTL